MITADDVYEAALELAGRMGLDEAEVLELTGITTGASVDEQIDAIRELYDESEAGAVSLAAPDAGGKTVIVPSDGTGYVELAGSQGKAIFKKHILNVGPGQTLLHPTTGERLTLDDSWYATLERNFRNKVCDLVAFPMADEKNRHSESPLSNGGMVTDLQRDGSKVYAVIEARKPEVIEGLRNQTIAGASAMINLNYKDTRDGRHKGPCLLHVAATNRPYVLNLQPYEEIVAASHISPDDVLLCAQPAPPVIRFTSPPSPARRSAVTRSAAPSIDVEADDIDAAVVKLTRDLHPDASDLDLAYACTDTRGALAELCEQNGMGHSAYEQALALGMLADRLDAARPGLGGEIRLTLSEDGDVLGLAAGAYAIPVGMVGPKSFLPTDTPDRLLRSWEQLHTHWRKRLSAEDFSSARDACIEAADELGIGLNDPAAILNPDGTPDVAATYGLPSSAVADEVDRYLALSASTVPALEGTTVPARSVTSAADLRLAGSPELPDDAYAVIGRHPEHFTRSERPGSAAAGRKASQRHSKADYEHDVTTPSQDDLTRANPSKGGHPSVDYYVRMGRELGMAMGESPQPGSRAIKPRTPAQRARERALSRPGHT